MLINSNDNNGLSNIKSYLFSLFSPSRAVLRTSRYLCRLKNANIHKVRSMTYYPQLLGYPNQDSSYEIPSRKSQNKFLETFPAHSSPLFLYTHCF